VSSNSDITISELDETEIPFRTPYEWLNETNNDNEATVTNSQLSDINDVRTLRSSINKNSIEWCTNDVTSDDVVNNLNIGDFYVSTDFSEDEIKTKSDNQKYENKERVIVDTLFYLEKIINEHSKFSKELNKTPTQSNKTLDVLGDIVHGIASKHNGIESKKRASIATQEFSKEIFGSGKTKNWIRVRKWFTGLPSVQQLLRIRKRNFSGN
jgi:hypothetical protein